MKRELSMKPVTPCILTINGGSSIIEVQLFGAGNLHPCRSRPNSFLKDRSQPDTTQK